MLTPLQLLDLRDTNILVVDDNEQSISLMTRMLTGFRVRQPGACRSAEEARGVLKTGRFDLLIVDYEMPEEDGLSLVSHVRESSREPNFTTPILLVSAHTPVDRIVRARDAGANLVVKKPVSPAILLSRISWLARSIREFVESPAYCGPDRRFRVGPPPVGVVERRADVLALTATPDRALSQGEVDSLFD